MSRDPKCPPPARESGAGLAVALTVVVLALSLALVGVVWLRSTTPPEGPIEPVWDRTPCARCAMLVGDRAFAAQLQAGDARVLDFDDPGCLFEHERDHAPAVHARWFRHVREDRWIEGGRAGFVPAEATPMGFGLGGVDAGAPGAISLEAARARILAGGAAPHASTRGAAPLVRPAAVTPCCDHEGRR